MYPQLHCHHHDLQRACTEQDRQGRIPAQSGDIKEWREKSPRQGPPHTFVSDSIGFWYIHMYMPIEICIFNYFNIYIYMHRSIYLYCTCSTVMYGVTALNYPSLATWLVHHEAMTCASSCAGKYGTTSWNSPHTYPAVCPTLFTATVWTITVKGLRQCARCVLLFDLRELAEAECPTNLLRQDFAMALAQLRTVAICPAIWGRDFKSMWTMGKIWNNCFSKFVKIILSERNDAELCNRFAKWKVLDPKSFFERVIIFSVVFRLKVPSFH